MTTTEKWMLGTLTSLLTTDLNSLANNARAISAGTYDNTQGGGGGDGYLLSDVELVVTFGGAPTANTAVSLWFIRTVDGSNYEDGDASITPQRAPDAVFPVRAVTSAQRIVRQAWLPPGMFKTLAMNDGTGQAMAASGNTVKVRPVARQGV